MMPVDGGGDEHDPLDGIGVADGDLGDDLRPHRMAEEDHGTTAEVADVRRDEVGEAFHRGRALRLRRIAVAGQVQRDDERDREKKQRMVHLQENRERESRYLELQPQTSPSSGLTRLA